MTEQELEEAWNDPNLLFFFNQMGSKRHTGDRANSKVDTPGDYEKRKVKGVYLRDMYFKQHGQSFTDGRFS